MHNHTSAGTPGDSTKPNIHIFGAGRGIGHWLANTLFHQHPSLHCYDTDVSSLGKISNPQKAHHITTPDDLSPLHQYISKGGVYILAIPEDAILPTSKAITKLAPAESMLAIPSSVQYAVMNNISALNLATPPIGFHPLFGDTVASAIGQNVIMTNFNPAIALHRYLNEYMQGSGLIVTHLTLEEHDSHMSIIQALTHFCFLAFASALTTDNKCPNQSLLSLRTPNFQFLHAFTCRFLKIATTTTGSIQHAPGAKLMREVFIAAAQRLHSELTAAPDIKSASQIIESVRAPFDGAHIDEGAQAAAVAVDGIQRFDRLLFEFKKSQDSFIFRHRLTQKIHVVRISEIYATHIIYLEAKHMIKGRHALASNEISRENYKSMGINIKESPPQIIKKRNITFLSSAEIAQFWKTDVLLCSGQLNAINYLKLPESFFEKRLPILVPSIKECIFINAFRRRNEEETVTIEIKFDPRVALRDITAMSRAAIETYDS